MAKTLGLSKRQRTKYAVEVGSLKEIGLPIARIARKFGVSRQTIYTWLKLYHQLKTI